VSQFVPRLRSGRPEALEGSKAGFAGRNGLRATEDTFFLEDKRVAYIITEPCIGTKDASCVDVCPVDCIHPRKDETDFEPAQMLYIHPDECIDCGACVPACPVEAIFALDEVPDKWKEYIDINAKHFQK
jgi:ferredoxin